jgi:hypothetical protein
MEERTGIVPADKDDSNQTMFIGGLNICKSMIFFDSA